MYDCRRSGLLGTGCCRCWVFFFLPTPKYVGCELSRCTENLLCVIICLIKKGIPVSQNPEVSTDLKKTGNYIEINGERCKGCYLCITACPHDLIEKREVLNGAGCYPACPKNMAQYKCTACGLCWQMCPDAAIEVFKAVKEAGA